VVVVPYSDVARTTETPTGKGDGTSLGTSRTFFDVDIFKGDSCAQVGTQTRGFGTIFGEGTVDTCLPAEQPIQHVDMLHSANNLIAQTLFEQYCQ
jgi:hypothetical protein